MYGFAIWDSEQRKLVLGRDRLRIKPLYYWQGDDWLAFASEVKALLQLPFVAAQLDSAALRDLLAFGYVPGERSSFRACGVSRPATVLVVEGSTVTSHRYWRLPPGQITASRKGNGRKPFATRWRSAVRRTDGQRCPDRGFLERRFWTRAASSR
jgi:asparagine synthase (glutamine-hydrolysing)